MSDYHRALSSNLGFLKKKKKRRRPPPPPPPADASAPASPSVIPVSQPIGVTRKVLDPTPVLTTSPSLPPEAQVQLPPPPTAVLPPPPPMPPPLPLPPVVHSTPLPPLPSVYPTAFPAEPVAYQQEEVQEIQEAQGGPSPMMIGALVLGAGAVVAGIIMLRKRSERPQFYPQQPQAPAQPQATAQPQVQPGANEAAQPTRQNRGWR